MSSQRSGSKQSDGRQSILQGVYEENVRTRAGEPAPRRGGAANGDESASPPLRRWIAALGLVAIALAGTYAAGGTAFVQRHLLAQGRAAMGAAPVAGSLRGRAAPFADTAAAAAEPPRALPLGSDGTRSVAGLFGLEIKTVVLDPGHGGEKDGAVGPGGTREKHVALDVARRLRRRLRARYGYRVLMTRTGDEHRSLRERVQFANRSRADLFLSIHVNALPDTSVTSVETYYYGPEAPAEVRQLARRENRASGYSVAEFNRLLEDAGRRLRRQESKRLAGSIQSSLFRNVRTRNATVRDWGVRTAPFVVLLGVEAPSVLAEIGVLSNADDEARLRRPAYRAALAGFLEEGVARYLAAAPPVTDSTAADSLAAGPPANASPALP